MKKSLHFLAIASLVTMSVAHAEPAKVECSTNTTFGQNTCDVCYTETFHAKEAPAGWSSTITDVMIPWEHSTGDLDEIIYDTAQKLPEIKGTLTVTTKPTKPEDLWKNHETLIWKPFDDHKEYVLKKGEKVGLYRLAQDASLTVQGKKPEDTLLISTPLSVGNFNADTNEETAPKIRNICVLGKFAIDKPEAATPTQPAVATPAPATTPTTTPAIPTPTVIDTATAIEKSAEAEIPVLNAAEPEPVIVAAPEETETKSGPEIWIFLVLAFILTSGWNAWRKQKV